MMRDRLREQIYFIEYIKFQKERYKKFEHIMRKVIEQRGENDPAINNIYLDLIGFQFNELFSMYSGGKEIKEIREFIPNIIDNMEKVNTHTISYYYIVTILSVSVLTDTDKVEINRLREIVKASEIKDYLVDFILQYVDSSWIIQNTDFQYKTPYAYLNKVIHMENPEIAARELKFYLENIWYSANRDAGWYDTHKIKDDYIYSGYWSFESGAITKILQLDDSILKDFPYYPYDMVHYQEN